MARYDDVADTYALGAEDYEQPALRELLRLTAVAGGERVLDLACGEGVVARELVRRGAEVTGVDLSERMLALARRQSGDEIEFVVGNAADLAPVLGREFDLVVSNFGLSDIDDLDGVCRSVGRVLVPGGRFVFSILHPCFQGAGAVSGSWPANGTYYDEGFWRADGSRSTLRQVVGANHRMLSTYLNALVAAGLVVDEVVEPRPEEAWAAAAPGTASQPVYLVIRCHRAST